MTRHFRSTDKTLPAAITLGPSKSVKTTPAPIKWVGARGLKVNLNSLFREAESYLNTSRMLASHKTASPFNSEIDGKRT